MHHDPHRPRHPARLGRSRPLLQLQSVRLADLSRPCHPLPPCRVRFAAGGGVWGGRSDERPRPSPRLALGAHLLPHVGARDVLRVVARLPPRHGAVPACRLRDADGSRERGAGVSWRLAILYALGLLTGLGLLWLTGWTWL